MRTLEFFVNVQRITKNQNCDFSGVAAGTKDAQYPQQEETPVEEPVEE